MYGNMIVSEYVMGVCDGSMIVCQYVIGSRCVWEYVMGV